MIDMRKMSARRPARGRARRGAGDLGLRQQAGRERASERRRPWRRPAASRTSWSMSATACSSKPTPSELTPQSRATLDKQAQWLTNYSQYSQFTIEGHADERGTREYNIALGARRAQTVRDYLISRGIQAQPHAHHLLRQGAAGRGLQRHLLLVAEPPRGHGARREFVRRSDRSVTRDGRCAGPGICAPAAVVRFLDGGHRRACDMRGQRTDVAISHNFDAARLMLPSSGDRPLPVSHDMTRSRPSSPHRGAGRAFRAAAGRRRAGAGTALVRRFPRQSVQPRRASRRKSRQSSATGAVRQGGAIRSRRPVRAARPHGKRAAPAHRHHRAIAVPQPAARDAAQAHAGRHRVSLPAIGLERRAAPPPQAAPIGPGNAPPPASSPGRAPTCSIPRRIRMRPARRARSAMKR